MQSKDAIIVDLTPENISEYCVCGYKDVEKHAELRKKIEWLKEYYPKGLRIKALITKDGGYQGMLASIPGKYAHRPVDEDSDAAPASPCAFGTFYIIFNGETISHHPISINRFENILKAKNGTKTA